MLDVDTTSLRALWFRHIPARGDPLYEPPDPADGRWQRGDRIEAWYFADEEATAWAEWYRAAAELGLAPGRMLPRDLWAWDLSLATVADLGDERRLARVGLAAPRPGRADWPAFQDVGEQLWSEGYEALMAPSAARPAHRVACVFRPARTVPGAEPKPPPRRIDEPPVVPAGMTT